MRTAILELGDSLHGIELNIGLGNAEIQLARFDRVHVVNRAAGTFDRATDTMLGALFVHQAADGAARGVIDTSHTAGTDRHELLLGHDARADQRAAHGQGGGNKGQFFHR